MLWSSDFGYSHFPTKLKVLTAQNRVVTSDFRKANEFMEDYHCPISRFQTFLCLSNGPRTSNPPSCTSSPWPSSPYYLERDSLSRKHQGRPNKRRAP